MSVLSTAPLCELRPFAATAVAPLLQFTAPEGVVLLPPKVVNCLWGLPDQEQQQQQHQEGFTSLTAAQNTAPAAAPNASSSVQYTGASSSGSSGRCSGRVYIRYKLLPKGTYVRFQPELRSFHEVVGADAEVMKAALEACLMGYCTLSEGDWVQVRRGGNGRDRGREAPMQRQGENRWPGVVGGRGGRGCDDNASVCPVPLFSAISLYGCTCLLPYRSPTVRSVMSPIHPVVYNRCNMREWTKICECWSCSQAWQCL